MSTAKVVNSQEQDDEVVVEEEEDRTFASQTTLPILGNEYHTSCQLKAGFNLTMIHCSDQFEVYDTAMLNTQKPLITNFGGEIRITGVQNSLATGDSQAITFVQNHTMMRLYRDVMAEGSPVRIEPLILIDLPEYDWYEEAFLFDGAVAVRVNDTNFYFFMLPLVESEVVRPVPRAPLVNVDNQVAYQLDYSEIMAYGFAPNREQPRYTMFGLKKREMVKVVFSYDVEVGEIFEKVTIVTNKNMTGNLMRIEVTEEFVIVSDSNGERPGITFYDHDWKLVKEFRLPRQAESPYNLDVYQIPDLKMLQVYIAGTNNISIIEHVKDLDGTNFFQLTEDILRKIPQEAEIVEDEEDDTPVEPEDDETPLDEEESADVIDEEEDADEDKDEDDESDVEVEEQPYASDQTYVAKSGDYLVIKQSSRRGLRLMPICSYKYTFSEENFTCMPCERGLKSYGLQSTECVTCMRAWLRGTNDEFIFAQYEQFCREGQVFSIVLFAVVPFLTVTLALICCCCSRASGIKGSEHMCEDEQMMKRRRNPRRIATRFVRKVTIVEDSDEGKDVKVERYYDNDRRYMTQTPTPATYTRKNTPFPGKEINEVKEVSDQGQEQRLETEGPLLTQTQAPRESDSPDEKKVFYSGGAILSSNDGRVVLGSQLNGGTQNLDDDHEFSDTENEHFSAPGQLVQQRGFPEEISEHHQHQMSLESCVARRDDGRNAETYHVRQTSKSNLRSAF